MVAEEVKLLYIELVVLVPAFLVVVEPLPSPLYTRCNTVGSSTTVYVCMHSREGNGVEMTCDGREDDWGRGGGDY